MFVVGGAAHIGVERPRFWRRRLGLHGQTVEAVFEDRLDVAIRPRAGHDRAGAGGLEPLGAVPLRQPEEPEAGAIALLRMRAALENRRGVDRDGGFCGRAGAVRIGELPVAVCGARIIGGILSAAMFPAVTAYVADVTSEDERSRGMAWEGTAVSLGVMFGPAFGGLLAGSDLQLGMGPDRLIIPAFSLPFFAAALLASLTLPVVILWLPDTLPSAYRKRLQRLDAW